MGIILQIGYVYSPNSLGNAAIFRGLPDGKELAQGGIGIEAV